jgi:hypothetical protein
MTIKLLFLRNKINYSISADVERLRSWLASLGLTAQIEYKDVVLPLSFKSFGVFGGKELFGLDGIKQKIRDEALVPMFAYDVVLFCYDDPKVQAGLANWTYPSDLAGAAFCEIVYRPDLVGRNGDILCHETLHAFNRLLAFRGIFIVDTLDNDNNWDRVWKLYQPLVNRMLAPYPLLTRISRIKEEIAYFQALLGLKKKQEIEQMILRVAQEEGVDGRTLLAVAKAESGLNPKAVNLNQDGSKDFGLFQLNDKWYKDIVFDEATEDPEMSARIAARRFKQGFMSDWTSVKSGAYKKYL